MLFVPLPFVVALLIVLLIPRTLAARDESPAPAWFAALLALYALLATLVGLRRGYGLVRLLPMQSVLAACWAPLAWLAFSGVGRPGAFFDARRDWPHLLAPVAVLDRHVGEPARAAARRPWRERGGRRTVRPVLPGRRARPGGAAPGGGPAGVARHVHEASPAGAAAADSDAPDDPSILETVRATLLRDGLFRDVDLTLERIARRSGVPARRVSGAIDRATGNSVSRYVSGLRLDDARRALTGSDDSVTEIVLGAGFRTKSNFNRVFRDAEGCSPSEWRAARRCAAPRHP